MKYIETILEMQWIIKSLQAVLILFVGYLFAKISSRIIKKILKAIDGQKKLSILERLAFYFILIVTIVLAMSHLGFDWKILVGTAGILTVALGFASQTSASNIISGIFLMFEKPFVVGDLIEVGNTKGYVLSIDLLSTRLRTFDNMLVRIPNEALMKSEFRNHTYFPIRRIDLHIGIAYKEDVKRVKEVLLELADKNLKCLDEPQPVIFHNGYGDSSVNLQLSIWTRTEEYWDLKTLFYEDIKREFDRLKIEIPFPQRTVHMHAEKQ